MKKYFTLIMIVMCCICVSAQVTHEISFNLGLGYSTLNYKILEGKRGGGVGGDFGFGYTCIFKEQWGFHLGLVPAFYNTAAKLDGTTIVTPNLMDSERDMFDMNTACYFKENQYAFYLNIPLMAHFQTKTKHPFYALAGFKFGIPLFGNYKMKEGSVSNAGYYHDYENELDSQEFAGFGKFDNRTSKGRLFFKATVMLSLEAGVKWNKESKHPIYTGIYFDYGLTNVAKVRKVEGENEPFVNYDPDNAPKFTTNGALPFLSDKVKTMAVGIRMRVLLSEKN